jgi:hypothetical protein
MSDLLYIEFYTDSFFMPFKMHFLPSFLVLIAIFIRTLFAEEVTTYFFHSSCQQYGRWDDFWTNLMSSLHSATTRLQDDAQAYSLKDDGQTYQVENVKHPDYQRVSVMLYPLSNKGRPVPLMQRQALMKGIDMFINEQFIPITTDPKCRAD